MSNPTSDNFLQILNDVCDGTFDETHIDELIALLEGDPTACQVYLDHLQLRRSIWLLGREEKVRERAITQVHATLSPVSSFPALDILSTALHGSVNYFSSGWPLAYLITTVIFASAILVGYFTPASTPSVSTQIAAQPVQQDLPSVDSKKDEIKLQAEMAVGRIINMVDCKFSVRRAGTEKHKSEIQNPKSLVAIGDKLILDSGLMEIAYDTGAHVILQGPCSYSVDSAAGGFLQLGKLTAQVEKRGGRDEGKSGWHADSSFEKNHAAAIAPPLFTVRTPTGVVNDLGTEFGVEVAMNGDAKVAVFVGKVFFASNRDGKQGLQLTKGQVGTLVASGKRPVLQAPEKFATHAGSFIRTTREWQLPVDPKAECALITTAVVHRELWNYTFNKPGDGWNQRNFNDKSWSEGGAGFGVEDLHTPNITVNTTWRSNDIWLRKSFSLRHDWINFNSAALTLRHDDDVEVYVNGKLVFAESGYNIHYSLHDVSETLRKAMREGENLIAVHVRQDYGGQYFDLGLTLNKKFVNALPSSEMESGVTYRCTSDPPSKNWASPTFDDNGWRQIPSKIACGLLANDEGLQKSNNVWLRKKVDLDKLPAAYRAELQTSFSGECKIFVNGKLVFHKEASTEMFEIFDVTKELAGVLHKGENVFAIHVQKKSANVDFGVVLYPTEKIVDKKQGTNGVGPVETSAKEK